MYKTIILSVALYGCETEERRQIDGVWGEQMGIRRNKKQEGWKKLHNFIIRQILGL
jgi:hypothetical protein